MKKIQILLMTLMVSATPVAFAEILEVYNWKANPGQAQKMLSVMNESAEIHRALGAQVTINLLDVGSENQVDYVVRFDDMKQWGSFKDSLATDKKWNDLWAKVSRKPTGELQMSLVGINTDSSVKASDFDQPFVYGVWVWDPATGRTADVMAIQQKYKEFQTQQATLLPLLLPSKSHNDQRHLWTILPCSGGINDQHTLEHTTR